MEGLKAPVFGIREARSADRQEGERGPSQFGGGPGAMPRKIFEILHAI